MGLLNAMKINEVIMNKIVLITDASRGIGKVIMQTAFTLCWTKLGKELGNSLINKIKSP